MQTASVKIRERQNADLEELETSARRVHTSDRYPIYLSDDDFRRFLTQPASTAAWVATVDDRRDNSWSSMRPTVREP